MASGGLSKAGQALKIDLTKGKILGNLWIIAWPLLITSTLNVIGPAIDMIWIGKLGVASVAGVGVSGIAVTVMNSLVGGLFTGTSAMVARFIGAKDEASANRAAQQAFVIGIAFSIFMAIIGLFLAEDILRLLGVDPAAVAQGASYLRIQLVGMVTMTSISVSQSVMQASGDSRTPMKVAIGYRLLHICLCPLLVFGVAIFPRLGVNGAAISNIFSQAVGGGIGIWILFSGRTRIRVTLKNFHLDRNFIWRAVRIGLPSSLTFMQRSLADLATLWLVIPFGTLAVAAHSLMQRLDSFVQTPAAGIGTAAGVMAGQNLGANQPGRAARAGWMAALLATGLSVIFSIIIWFWSEPIFRIFTPQADLVNLASTFLRINIASYVVWGVVVALSMCLNGVGDTMVPMVTNLLTMVGLQVGMAFYLSRYTSLGVFGVRWAVVSGIVVRGAIYSIYFYKGRWKRKKV